MPSKEVEKMAFAEGPRGGLYVIREFECGAGFIEPMSRLCKGEVKLSSCPLMEILKNV